MKLLDIKIVQTVDTDPWSQLSELGEYSDSPSDVFIDRQFRGHMTRRSYRYFNVSSNYDGCHLADRIRYMHQDYQRAESFNRGDWHYVGIHAVATFQTRDDGPIQKLTSSGLWGIESDSDPDYLATVADDELTEVCDELWSIGFSLLEIQTIATGVKS